MIRSVYIRVDGSKFYYVDEDGFILEIGDAVWLHPDTVQNIARMEGQELVNLVRCHGSKVSTTYEWNVSKLEEIVTYQFEFEEGLPQPISKKLLDNSSSITDYLAEQMKKSDECVLKVRWNEQVLAIDYLEERFTIYLGVAFSTEDDYVYIGRLAEDYEYTRLWFITHDGIEAVEPWRFDVYPVMKNREAQEQLRNASIREILATAIDKFPDDTDKFLSVLTRAPEDIEFVW